MTAGTIMHRSHLPLKTWLMAVHIVTSHSNGISALQLQAQLGLGSYKSAWLLLLKLRRAMVDPDRSLLEDLVEIDEATLPFRTVKDPTTGGQGRSRQGKMCIAGAVELSPEGEPRRIRLAPIGDFSARSLHAFVAGTSAPGARVITDGWSGYPGLPDHDHQPKVVGATPAHLVLIWIHRVFSNLKRSRKRHGGPGRSICGTPAWSGRRRPYARSGAAWCPSGIVHRPGSAGRRAAFRRKSARYWAGGPGKPR